MDWPVCIDLALHTRFGPVVETVSLKGIKTDGGCFRVRCESGSAVVKRAEPSEYAFYTECLPLLGDVAAHVPALHCAAREGDAYWLALEDIPHPLPRERWQADRDVMDVLRRLHRSTGARALPVEGGYTPGWSDDLTEAALLWDREGRFRHRERLRELQRRAQPLFDPSYWLNGDTNPTNWGLRDDGTVVLFDWERVCLGSPAIDIAITLPGCGSADGIPERAAADAYCRLCAQAGDPVPAEPDELALQVRLAKTWSVVEFLAENGRNVPEEQRARILTALEEIVAAIP